MCENSPQKPGTAIGVSVEIMPQGWKFHCVADQTLLLAALAAGYRLPHSCRNGTCRACMVRLLQGQIRYRIEWPGLLAEEKAEGWILPCVACPSDGPLRIEATHTQDLDAPRRSESET